MTAAGTAAHRGGLDTSGARVTFPRVMHAEWTKLWSLRSTWVSITVTALLIVAFGLVQSHLTARHLAEPGGGGGRDAAGAALNGFGLAPFAVGVLGVLVIGGEYATGTIRVTLSAVPRRLPVLWAKAAVFGAVVFAVCLAAAVTAFLASQWLFLSGTRLSASLGTAGVPRALAGAALDMALIGVLSLGIGALARNTAGGITATVGLLLLAPGLVHFLLPDSSVAAYLPSDAGQALMSLARPAGALGPWTGLAVLCCYPVAVLGAAAVLLVRRDA
ncbi:ABC transporter permease [Actinomadura violacea]|uniref:ABC transporter permease n=1 Tax=Actinomadura violacea TaxID=2819934 RepID=A0ABS3RN08_9ACTN|nr:ABC transporter permease [Actinomadura violacea]MBO2458144.1 ABC transporter permease [Actinomadura violacea]